MSEEQRPYVRANLNYELGKIARDRGDWQVARAHLRAARDVFCQDGDDPIFNLEFAWIVQCNLALVEHRLGDLDGAAQRYEQTLAYFRSINDRAYLPTVQVRLAALEEQRGNLATALEHAREALEWSRKLGLVQERAQAEAIMARLEQP
jgi:tetratricopeptide (TPR) repeat protein